MLFYPIIKAVIYYDMKNNLLTKNKRERFSISSPSLQHTSQLLLWLVVWLFVATGLSCVNVVVCMERVKSGTS